MQIPQFLNLVSNITRQKGLSPSSFSSIPLFVRNISRQISQYFFTTRCVAKKINLKMFRYSFRKRGLCLCAVVLYVIIIIKFNLIIISQKLR